MYKIAIFMKFTSRARASTNEHKWSEQEDAEERGTQVVGACIEAARLGSTMYNTNHSYKLGSKI